MNSSKQQKPPYDPPLPPVGSERWLRFIHPFRFLLIAVILIFSTEKFLGHPAIIWNYYGQNSSDYCQCQAFTILGEEHYVQTYPRTLITFVKEPRVKIAPWLWSQAKWLFNHLGFLSTHRID